MTFEQRVLCSLGIVLYDKELLKLFDMSIGPSLRHRRLASHCRDIVHRFVDTDINRYEAPQCYLGRTVTMTNHNLICCRCGMYRCWYYGDMWSDPLQCVRMQRQHVHDRKGEVSCLTQAYWWSNRVDKYGKLIYCVGDSMMDILQKIIR